MSKINVGRNTFATSIKKSGRYELSFNRLHVGENVIKVVNKKFKEFETITVYINAGCAESLEFPSLLKTKLGFLIPDIIVKVLDEFVKDFVAKSEIDQRNWQFLPSGSLKFSPHHLSKAIQTDSQDGTITFSRQCTAWSICICPVVMEKYRVHFARRSSFQQTCLYHQILHGIDSWCTCSVGDQKSTCNYSE